MSVIDEIAAERKRQIDDEGYTPERDDLYRNEQLARAAVCYADPKRIDKPDGGVYGWPWGANVWKPKDRRTDLIRAAALIVAEIERLDRLTSNAAHQGLERTK